MVGQRGESERTERREISDSIQCCYRLTFVSVLY